MATSPHHTYRTVAEYLELDRNSLDARYEYIDGQVYMLAGGTINHNTVSLNIASFLRNALRGSPCRALNSGTRVYISENRYVYPDVVVTCSEQDRGQVDHVTSPRVIFEVLSPGTEDFDRGRKFLFYREVPTVQEYILVTPDYPRVELCRREKKDLRSFRTLGLQDILDLTSINVHIPIPVLYEDIELIQDKPVPPS